MVVASSTNASVLLTGASRGLGYALAEEHLEHGSRVVATVRGPGRTVLHDLQQGVGGRLEIEQVVTNELSPLRVIETLGELISADETIAVMPSGQGSGTVRG